MLKYFIVCYFNVLNFLANFTVVSEILISALYNTLMCSKLYIWHQLKEWREQWYWLIDKRINPTCNERQLVRSCPVAWCGSWHSWWNQSWRHSEHWLRNPSTEGSGNVSQNGWYLPIINDDRKKMLRHTKYSDYMWTNSLTNIESTTYAFTIDIISLVITFFCQINIKRLFIYTHVIQYWPV